MTRLAAALLLLVACLPVVAQQPAGDPVTARTFEIHYKPLADAADVVSPLLSDSGEITFRPRLKTLVIEDRRSVLGRIHELLKGWDLPPQNVEVTLTLLLGTDTRREDAAAPRADHGLSHEVRGVLDKLSNFTKWTTYEPLGSRSVTGTEGSTVVTDLSADYRVVFVVESVHQDHGTVKFEKLQLQRVVAEEDGGEATEDLFTAGMVVPPGKLKLVGAAADPNSNRALFLALETRPRN
jgi:hypothetical protein